MKTILLLLIVIIEQFNLINMIELLKTEILRRLECSLFESNECGCPVDGEWSIWSEWSQCRGECGQVGLKHRFKECKNPAPAFGGEPCVGPSTDVLECRMPGCTESDYIEIARCDNMRMSEYKVLHRFHKIDPALVERCLLTECHYSLVKNILGRQADHYWNALHCLKHNNGCPVPGGWSRWGKWSECSADYGSGKKIRCRTCDSPKPTHPKLFCKGSNCTTESCQGSYLKQPKRGTWGSWSSWSSCSASCGQGLLKRVRFCVKKQELTTPFHLAPRWSSTCTRCHPWLKYKYCENTRYKRDVVEHTFCVGPHTEIEPCYLKPCPVDGEWSEWEPWSQCSTACGVGIQSRSRACSSPPPAHGGEPCCGPYTWIRHCFLEPCRSSKHELVTFDGNAAMYYHRTNRPTRLFHLYIKIKPFTLNGDIFTSTSTNSLRPEFCNKISLSLAAGYIVLSVYVGHCNAGIITHRSVKIRKWYQVLIVLSGSHVTMRIDDSENIYESMFNCVPKAPNLDGEFTVGGSFRGQLQKLHVNFIKKELKITAHQTTKQKYIYPSSVKNVIYENPDYIEGRNLDDMILIPCSKSAQLTIELVVKTASHDGLLMLLKHFYENKFLLLYMEPRRVVLKVVIDDCIYECFQPLEIHHGRWTYIVVDYNKDNNWGLAVNGGIRKVITNYNVNMKISCNDYIAVGDIAQLCNRLEGKLALINNRTNIPSITGILSFVKINNKIFDVTSLPAIVERGNTPFSSEAISYSQNYVEIELLFGQQLNLTCFYGPHIDKKKTAFFCSESYENEPLWLKLDIPLNLNDKKLMDQIGILYKIIDNGDTTVFMTVSYESIKAIEGYYSCMVQNSIHHSVIITYGVNIVDMNFEFSSNWTSILKIILHILLILYTITVIWLLYECRESCIRIGLFTSINIVKRLSKPAVCEISHDPDRQFTLGIMNKKSNKKKGYFGN